MARMLAVKTFILILTLTIIAITCGRAKPEAVVQAAAKVDFNTQVRPLLESRCTPCHFAGGTMYERLPFDRPETIRKLGTRLFTRLKAEEDQRLIREFLAQ